MALDPVRQVSFVHDHPRVRRALKFSVFAGLADVFGPVSFAGRRDELSLLVAQNFELEHERRLVGGMQ